jgi:hypothetical protein
MITSWNVSPDYLHAVLAQALAAGWTCLGFAPYTSGTAPNGEQLVTLYRVVLTPPPAGTGARGLGVVAVPGAVERVG